MDDRDRALAELASGQAWTFSRRQAIELGLSEKMMDTRKRSAAWEPTDCPRVYRLGAHPATWEQRAWAAWLWGGPQSALSHDTAAAWYGLDRFRRLARSPTHLTTTKGVRQVPAGVITHRSSLQGPPRRTPGGLLVASPLDTLVGIATTRAPDVVDDAMESAFDLGLLTPDALTAGLSARPGSGRLRALLDRRAPGRPRQSRLEGAFDRLVYRATGHHLTRQHPVRTPEGDFFLDYAAVPIRVGFELDGFAKLWTKAAKQAFLRRATALALAGWRLLHFSWDDVMGDGAYVVSAVTSAAP